MKSYKEGLSSVHENVEFFIENSSFDNLQEEEVPFWSDIQYFRKDRLFKHKHCKFSN